MIYSFPPFVNKETKILILGTMPGIASLEKQQYYAHPRNHFWKILFALFDKKAVSEIYEERIQLLIANKIGIWDVLENCERKGSLDIHIKNQQPNDFEKLLKLHPAIKTIVFNGKESHRYFCKSFGQIKGITYYVMPSTSPANTISFENKLKSWSAVFNNL